MAPCMRLGLQGTSGRNYFRVTPQDSILHHKDLLGSGHVSKSEKEYTYERNYYFLKQLKEKKIWRRGLFHVEHWILLCKSISKIQI